MIHACAPSPTRGRKDQELRLPSSVTHHFSAFDNILVLLFLRVSNPNHQVTESNFLSVGKAICGVSITSPQREIQSTSWKTEGFESHLTPIISACSGLHLVQSQTPPYLRRLLISYSRCDTPLSTRRPQSDHLNPTTGQLQYLNIIDHGRLCSR